MILELITQILKKGITPNEFYLLVTKKQNISPILINREETFNSLKQKGYYNEDGSLTQKANALLEEMEGVLVVSKIKQKAKILGADFEANIQKYRLMFPSGKLPSGLMGRVNQKELENKFIWFFNNYKHTWETVFKATERYISEYAPNGYMYMQNSGFFISKQDIHKNTTSQLATYCDDVLDNDYSTDDFIPVIRVR